MRSFFWLRQMIKGGIWSIQTNLFLALKAQILSYIIWMVFFQWKKKLKIKIEGGMRIFVPISKWFFFFSKISEFLPLLDDIKVLPWWNIFNLWNNLWKDELRPLYKNWCVILCQCQEKNLYIVTNQYNSIHRLMQTVYNYCVLFTSIMSLFFY